MLTKLLKRGVLGLALVVLVGIAGCDAAPDATATPVDLLPSVEAQPTPVASATPVLVPTATAPPAATQAPPRVFDLTRRRPTLRFATATPVPVTATVPTAAPTLVPPLAAIPTATPVAEPSPTPPAPTPTTPVLPPTPTPAPPVGPTAPPAVAIAPTPTPAFTPTATATPLPAVNTAPALQVLEFNGRRVSTGVNLTGGRNQEVSIKLVARDENGNLAYIALIEEKGTVLAQESCVPDMTAECTLVLTMTSSEGYGQRVKFNAVAVDGEGLKSQPIGFIVGTNVPPAGGSKPKELPEATPTPEPEELPEATPTPEPEDTGRTITTRPQRPAATKPIVAGEATEVVHPSGVKIELPMDGTAGPEEEEFMVSIQEIDPPAGNVLPVTRIYDISVTGEGGREVPLREPATITLPYTLPAGKTAADVALLHWDEQLGRWELVEGAVVNAEEQTVTAQVTDLSPHEVAFFLEPMHFLGVSLLSLVGPSTLRPSYDAGFKHLVSFYAAEGVPLPFLPLFRVGKLGIALILDVDDLASLPSLFSQLEKLPINIGRPLTVEGNAGYVTFGVNGTAALSLRAGLGPSAGISFTMPKTGRYPGTRYNYDPRFESSISALTIEVPFAEASFLNVNENGNISPVEAQFGTCLTCDTGLTAGNPPAEDGFEELGVSISIASTTFNIFEGEFNTNILNAVLGSFLQADREKCYESSDPEGSVSLVSFSGELLCSLFTGAGSAITTILEKAVAPYTEYEHRSPTDVAMLNASFFNNITAVEGGNDVDGAGRGDLAFPSSSPGLPMQILVASDRFDTRSYFLELLYLTEGWTIELDSDQWPGGELNDDHSDDAIFRVDFEFAPLILGETHWKVTAAEDAPNAARVAFRLIHDRALFQDDILDEVSFTIWQQPPLSDLALTATVAPDPVFTGAELTYSLQIENRGPEPAALVELNMLNLLGEKLSLVTATDGQSAVTCGPSERIKGQTCELGQLAAGDTVDLTLEFRLLASLPQDVPLSANFSVESALRDPNIDNNSAVVETEVRVAHREFLVQLYGATGGTNWRYNHNWLSDEPLDDWYGVEAVNGSVVGLDLYDNNLAGDLPVALSELEDLQYLILTRNQLTGAIPEELGSLTRLRRLLLSSNRLTGQIPSDLGNLSNLTELYLDSNDLTGPIPESLGSLTNLHTLFLYGRNVFSGCIPDGLRAVRTNDLANLELRDCGESGERIPFARNPAEYFNGLPQTAHGIWSDGETMWVGDDADDKIYAYDLETKARVPGQDFDTLIAAGNTRPHGIWSDGETMWVGDDADDKLFAYDLETKARVPGQDFDTLIAAGNENSRGIWSDGETMWVTDWGADKLYAYDLATKARVPGQDFDTLIAAGNNAPGGIWSDGETMWVADWGADKLYAYDLATKVRVPGQDFDTLSAAGNNAPLGIWSDGETMWVADWGDVKLYAYDLETKARVPGKDFDTLSAAGNTRLRGIWSDGETMWVADLLDDKIYAYDLATKARVPGKDFDTLRDAGNNATGIWSDGETMWVADFIADKIYAYDLATKARVPGKDFDTLRDAGNNAPLGIWSDGETMWVADSVDDKLYAYDLATTARVPGKDFDTLSAAGNDSPYGIWSDEETMWVADPTDAKLYAYDLATKARVPGKDFDTLRAAGNDQPIGIWSDGETMWVSDPTEQKIYAYNMP